MGVSLKKSELTLPLAMLPKVKMKPATRFLNSTTFIYNIFFIKLSFPDILSSFCVPYIIVPYNYHPIYNYKLSYMMSKVCTHV